MLVLESAYLRLTDNIGSDFQILQPNFRLIHVIISRIDNYMGYGHRFLLKCKKLAFHIFSH